MEIIFKKDIRGVSRQSETETESATLSHYKSTLTMLRPHLFCGGPGLEPMDQVHGSMAASKVTVFHGNRKQLHFEVVQKREAMDVTLLRA